MPHSSATNVAEHGASHAAVAGEDMVVLVKSFMGMVFRWWSAGL